MRYRFRTLLLVLATSCAAAIAGWLVSDSWLQLAGWLVVVAFFVAWYWLLVYRQNMHPMTRGDDGNVGGEGGTGGVGAW